MSTRRAQAGSNESSTFLIIRNNWQSKGLNSPVPEDTTSISANRCDELLEKPLPQEERPLHSYTVSLSLAFCPLKQFFIFKCYQYVGFLA